MDVWRFASAIATISPYLCSLWTLLFLANAITAFMSYLYVCAEVTQLALNIILAIAIWAQARKDTCGHMVKEGCLQPHVYFVVVSGNRFEMPCAYFDKTR